MPAFAGIQKRPVELGSRLRGNDGTKAQVTDG